jgi:Tfp pilus assembly protein PilP
MTVPMNEMKKIVLTVIVSVAVVAVFSCKEKAPPAPQPHVVKQKIATQQPKPAQMPAPAAAKDATAAQPQNSALSTSPAPAASAGSTPAVATGSAAAVPPDAGSGSNQAVSDLVKESMAISQGYDPQGRIDPFEPLFREETTAQTTAAAKGKHKKRIPQTPLERVALSQLKLSAIMRTPKGNSAIVEDATGKGYVIKKGTYIGLNSGQVVKIDGDGVLIEEEIENVMGEFVIQNTELKLQKPAGEL